MNGPGSPWRISRAAMGGRSTAARSRAFQEMERPSRWEVVGPQKSRLRHHWRRSLAWRPSRQPIVPSALHRVHCQLRRLVPTLGSAPAKVTHERNTGASASIQEGTLVKARHQVAGSGDPQGTRHPSVAMGQSRVRHSVTHVLDDVEITWQDAR